MPPFCHLLFWRKMKRAIIIGAGPAGLTAGYELLKQSGDYEVILLEQSNRVGGISCTVNCDGNRMDMGGHRFFSKNQEVMEWWENILPLQSEPAYDDKKLGRKTTLAEKGADPEKEDQVFLIRKRVSRIYYRNRFFDYPVKLDLVTMRNLGFFTMLQAGGSYLKAQIFKRKESSLEDFYVNRFGEKLYHIFFENYTEKVWGRPPREISPDWGAQRVKGLSVAAILKEALHSVRHAQDRQVETSLIDTFYYPKYGPGQMWEEVAAKFQQLGGTIRYGCKVNGIVKHGKKIEKILFLEKGEQKELETDVVYSSMPVKELVSVMNGVPEKIRNIGEGLPYRGLVTVGLLVDDLKLKNTTTFKTLGKLIPDCWIYVQDAGIKMGRIQIFNNWSPYIVKDPEKSVWLGLEYFCEEGDSLWRMSDEQWQQLGKAELVKMGILEEADPIHLAHCERIPKAYPAYFDTYSQMPDMEAWLDGVENLYCIGRNGQHRYNNMDHSMLTAMEAVKCQLSGNPDKKGIWQVNTEQEYQEEKKEK